MFLRYAIAMLLFLTACGSSGGMRRLNDEADKDLLGILVTPEEVVVPQGGTVQLTATGLYANRKTRDLTAAVDWSSKDKGVAKANEGLDGEGVFTAIAVGTTQVSASMKGIESPPVIVRVTDQTVTALQVEPAELILEKDQEVELVATATFSDGSRSDATGLVRWITDDGSVATLAGGVLTASGVGATQIHAQYEDVVSNAVPVEVLAEASADLRIATLSASPYSDSITAVIEVENVGSAGASGFWVDAFLDFTGVPGPGDYGDAYERVSWLGPGSTTQIVLELDVSGAGLYDVDVVVDTEDEIDETNEDDNHADTSVNVSGGGTTPTEWPPDLAIDRVDFISDGTWVYYEVEISNYGDVGAGPFWVDVWGDQWSSPSVGDDGDDWTQISWLAAWDTVTVDFLIEIDCDWGCDSWVFVDSQGDVAEATETDNLESLYVY